MKKLAFFLAVLALALAFIGLYQKAHADTTTSKYDGENGAWAEVSKSEDSLVRHIVCTGNAVDDIVGICHDTLVKLCPNGGRLSNMGETPEGVLPASIEFDVVCTEDGTS